jgi:hypothetical protein
MRWLLRSSSVFSPAFLFLFFDCACSLFSQFQRFDLQIRYLKLKKYLGGVVSQFHGGIKFG